MIIKVITMTLIAICGTHCRSIQPSRENELQALKSNKHHIPDFRSEKNYLYKTPKPNIPDGYQIIQYAPLHLTSHNKNKQTATEPSTSTTIVSTTQRKSHLEPRVEIGHGAVDSMKCYNPGNNIGALPSVSRSPGHNAVYRKVPETTEESKYNLRSIELNQGQPLTTTMIPLPLAPDNLAKRLSITKQHFVLSPSPVGPAGPIRAKKKRQYTPYSKFHRLHLNIARVYSSFQLLPKAAVISGLQFERLPANQPAYMPPLYQALPALNQRTLLYPTNDHPKNYRAHLKHK